MLFTDLPLEIHHRIVSYLLDNRDVAALSTQCRALHLTCDMAARKKYHQIDISEGDFSVDEAFKFLLEILKQPNLALYVRHLKYHTPVSRMSTEYKDAVPMRELSTQEMNLIRNAVKSGGFIGPEQDRVVNMLLQRVDRALHHFNGFR